jgi:hypothetical protein
LFIICIERLAHIAVSRDVVEDEAVDILIDAVLQTCSYTVAFDAEGAVPVLVELLAIGIHELADSKGAEFVVYDADLAGSSDWVDGLAIGINAVSIYELKVRLALSAGIEIV